MIFAARILQGEKRALEAVASADGLADSPLSQAGQRARKAIPRDELLSNRSMTTFYLVRHGDKSHTRLMLGRMPGVHLTSSGREQARRVARFLSGAEIRRIYSSPLERAMETAAPLVKMLNLPIEESPAFHEVDMGKWTGLSRKRVQRLPSWRQFCRFPAGIAIPGGETLAEVQGRMAAGMIRLRQQHPNNGIAIFTHEDPIRLAICYFIGAPINAYEHISVGLGSVSVLKLDAQRAILDRIDLMPFAKSPRRRGR